LLSLIVLYRTSIIISSLYHTHTHTHTTTAIYNFTENAYYNSKGLRETDLQEAADEFEKVIIQEREELASKNEDGGGSKKCGPWSFKCIKQLVKLQLRIGSTDSVLSVYSRLLECIDEGNVSPSAVEKGINGMLERVASLLQGNAAIRGGVDASSNNLDPQKLALAVYDSTLRVFHPSTGSCPNDRLWFKTNLKYGQLLYEMNETTKLQQVLRDLQTTQEQQSNSNTNAAAMGDTTNGSSNSSNNTQSLEIYALQMQLYSRQKDSKKLRQVFNKAMAVRGGIPHPRTLATIQELGGKMVSGAFFFFSNLSFARTILFCYYYLFCYSRPYLLYTYLYCSICKQKSTRLRAKLSFKPLRATTKREIKVVFVVSNT
jgi:COP9 signalosome complex subunit 2